MGRKFVQQSIKRLIAAKLISVEKSDRKRVSNRYEFAKMPAFNMVPYDFFDSALTPSEKGMLLALRQFFVSPDLRLTTSKGINGIAFGLGVTYKTVYTQYRALVAKGYIAESIVSYPNGFSYKKVFLTDKLHWMLPQLRRQLEEPLQLPDLQFGDGFGEPIDYTKTIEILKNNQHLWIV